MPKPDKNLSAAPHLNGDVHAAPEAELFRRFSLQHPSLLGSAGLAFFVLVKTYAAARFSLTTSAAIVGTAPASVLLGTVLSYSYFVFPLVGAAAFSWGWDLWKRRSEDGAALASCSFVLAGVAVLVSPPKFLILELAAIAVPFSVCLLLRKSKAHFQVSPPRVVRFSVLAIGVVVFLATLQQLWIPVELVKFSDPGGNNQEAVGHVVSVDGQWATLVTAETRKVIHIPSPAVASRDVCHHWSQPEGHAPLYLLLLGRTYESPNRSCSMLASKDAIR